MFHKDTLRLIKKTFKRFLTIFLMVLIGVSFMVGLLATKPIMHKSVDIYYDETNFMDVQVYSSYGFNHEDVKALQKSEVVEDISATRFVDVMAHVNEKSYVTRVQEISSDVNHYELISGRMPQNEQEALTLGSSSFGTAFKEGTTVSLYLEDGEVSDSLAYEEYTIVGTLRSPQYMSSSKETSTLNNLNIEGVIYVDNDDFKSKYYTSIYLTIQGADEYVAFSKEYKNYIEKNIKELELIADSQENHIKEEIIQEIEAEIEKGEKELLDQTSLAQKEIDEGYKQLNDAYQKIADGEKEIQTNEQKLLDGQKEIDKNRQLLEKNQLEIENAKKQIEQETGKDYDDAVAQIVQLHDIYIALEEIQKESENNTTLSELVEENKTEVNELRKENTKLTLQLLELQFKGASDEEIAAVQNQIEENNTRIEVLTMENVLLEQVIQIVDNKPINKVLGLLDRLSNGSVKESYANIMQLKEGERQIQEGFSKLESAQKEIDSGKVQIEKAKKELEAGKKDYEAGLVKLKKGQAELDEKSEEGRIELEKAKQQLDELPEAGWMILDRESHFSTAMYDSNAEQMGKIGAVFPLLFFLVAALVCMTTMKRLVDEQRGQIGIFSALGFSKNQIIGKYVLYAFIASILGSLIGIVIGIPIFPNVIYFCWRLMYDLPDAYLYLPFQSALIGVCSFTLLIVIVTYFVARSSLKEVPSQLMRPKAPKKAKKVFLENVTWIWNRLSFTSKVTARNLIRYKSRFFMTIIGVAGCTSLLVLGFGIKDSISSIIDIQYGEVILYDITVTLDDHKMLDEWMDEFRKEDDVETIVPLKTYSTKVYLDEEKTMNTYIVSENNVDDILDLRERKRHVPLELDQGVIISEKFSKLHNIQVGDKIKIESSHGLKKEVEVSGICEMYFQHHLFITEEYYEEIFNETVYYDQIAISTNSTSFISDYENEEGIKSVTDFEVMKDMFKTMIEALDIIVIVILLASGSLAFVVLVNLTEVNISERIREIATLKVLGFNDQEVNMYIFKEIFLLTILGAFIGLGLGKIELGYVMSIIDMEITMFGNQIEPLSYIYGFMITIGFAILVSIFMRRSLRKVEMIESLKSVE